MLKWRRQMRRQMSINSCLLVIEESILHPPSKFQHLATPVLEVAQPSSIYTSAVHALLCMALLFASTKGSAASEMSKDFEWDKPYSAYFKEVHVMDHIRRLIDWLIDWSWGLRQTRMIPSSTFLTGKGAGIYRKRLGLPLPSYTPHKSISWDAMTDLLLRVQPWGGKIASDTAAAASIYSNQFSSIKPWGIAPFMLLLRLRSPFSFFFIWGIHVW